MHYLKIRNWDKWQSYRNDRGQPPWIKIHRTLLRCPEWVELTDMERGQLTSMWLLAADRGGVIPASASTVQKLCFMSKRPDFNRFISLGFIEDDASVTPPRGQDDANMTHQSRVEESREEKKESGANADARKTNGSEFERFWLHWPVKRNKKKALIAFNAKKFSHEDVDELISDIKIRIQNDRQWRDGYIPHCSTYLNGNRWEDDYGS